MAFIIDPSAPVQPASSAKPEAAQGGGAGDVVKDGSTATFMADVIEVSRDVPVIVDFWAPWCGPCKQLGPALERLVRQQKGLVRMVKINVDENQELAAQMRIQSIPAVYAFAGGQPVDGFVGALPESQLKAFVERLLGDAKPPLEAALEQAQAALDAGRPDEAHEIYAAVLSEDHMHAEATAGLLRALVAAGRVAEAADIAQRIGEPLRSEARVAQAITAIEMAEEAKTAGGIDVAGLEARVATDPADLQSRFDLGKALYAQGRTEAALDHLLEIVRRKRDWNDEAARLQIVKIFDALGPTHPTTLSYRRKLSSVLFT